MCRTIVLLACLCAHAAAAEKAWLADDNIIINHGDIQVRLSRDGARNAEWGSFYAHAISRTNGVSGQYHGACRPFLSLQFVASDTRRLDLEGFLASRAGADLPIHDVLDALLTELEGQCEELQAARLRFAPAHHTREDYTYTGTLTRASGWRLQDGIVATPYDQEHHFQIALRDPFSVAGVSYAGGCSDDPILTVAPLYQNNTERALGKDPDFASVVNTAQNAAAIYAGECPGTDSVRFIVDPIPEDYECAAAGDCFVEARREGEDWKADTSQFEPKEYYNPIGSFADITEVLAAGEHRILDDYRNFFAFYFESFIGIYSDHCRARLRDPVGREIQPIERRYDGGGMLIDEREAGPKRRIYVEGSYADAFDRYFGSWKAWGTMRMLQSMQARNPNQQLGLVWQSTSLAMGFFTGNYNSLEATVRGSCGDERIQTAYANMLNYAERRPAITGRFTTDKRPYEGSVENGSSAPQMAARLAEQEAAAAEARAQRSASERQAYEARKEAERVAYQQRIREQIDQRNAPRGTPAQPAPSAGAGSGTPAAPSAAEIQQLQQDLQQRLLEITELSRSYQQRIRAAETQEERAALQQEFQQRQQQAMAEYQALLQQARQRR